MIASLQTVHQPGLLLRPVHRGPPGAGGDRHQAHLLQRLLPPPAAGAPPPLSAGEITRCVELYICFIRHTGSEPGSEFYHRHKKKRKIFIVWTPSSFVIHGPECWISVEVMRCWWLLVAADLMMSNGIILRSTQRSHVRHGRLTDQQILLLLIEHLTRSIIHSHCKSMRQDPISHNTALPLPLTEGHNHFIPQLYNILYPDTAAETH